ncbi:MAG: hypothetical protein D6734_01555 [Candidatus Schekmanbacteria bacterium]|nr:MAG: hypothetical protein D6734_01555 [Candidatus Schekmanbacteria bacterium]
MLREDSKIKLLLQALILSLPLLSFETMIFLWVNKYSSVSPLLSKPIYVYVICIIVLTVTYLFFYLKRIGDNLFIVSLLSVLMIISTSSSIFFALRVSDNSKYYSDRNKKIRHIFLITADALRADGLSCYGNKEIQTPNLDKLARDSVFFKNAISPSSWTLPSLTSIQTGVSPTVHQTLKLNTGLSDKFMTLAEYLKEEKYKTAAIVRSPFLKPIYNLLQGFDDYYYFPRPFPSSVGPRILRKLPLLKWHFDISTDYSTFFAKQWIEANKDKNFFLWIHYFDPHAPYTPPEKYLPEEKPNAKDRISYDRETAEKIRNKKYIPSPIQKKWIKRLYEGEVLYIDDYIGRLIKYLKGSGLYDSSLIIFSSDHGEEFWEHGGVEHMHTLYNELLFVPLMIKLPNSSVKENITVPISTQRIMPTILDLCGIKINQECLRAESLASLWKVGEEGLIPEPIISIDNFKESVIFNNIKYIKYHKPEKEELFDLLDDSRETNSIVDNAPDYLETSRKALKAHFEMSKAIRSCLKIRPEKKINIDTDTLQSLKALGYVN